VFQLFFFCDSMSAQFPPQCVVFLLLQGDDDFFALFGHGGREDTSSGASDDPMDATQDEGSSDGELVQSSAVSC